MWEIGGIAYSTLKLYIRFKLDVRFTPLTLYTPLHTAFIFVIFNIYIYIYIYVNIHTIVKHFIIGLLTR